MVIAIVMMAMMVTSAIDDSAQIDDGSCKTEESFTTEKRETEYGMI